MRQPLTKILVFALLLGALWLIAITVHPPYDKQVGTELPPSAVKKGEARFGKAFTQIYNACTRSTTATPDSIQTLYEGVSYGKAAKMLSHIYDADWLTAHIDEKAYNSWKKEYPEDYAPRVKALINQYSPAVLAYDIHKIEIFPRSVKIQPYTTFLVFDVDDSAIQKTSSVDFNYTVYRNDDHRQIFTGYASKAGPGAQALSYLSGELERILRQKPLDEFLCDYSFGYLVTEATNMDGESFEEAVSDIDWNLQELIRLRQDLGDTDMPIESYPHYDNIVHNLVDHSYIPWEWYRHERRKEYFLKKDARTYALIGQTMSDVFVTLRPSLATDTSCEDGSMKDSKS